MDACLFFVVEWIDLCVLICQFQSSIFAHCFFDSLHYSLVCQVIIGLILYFRATVWSLSYLEAPEVFFRSCWNTVLEESYQEKIYDCQGCCCVILLFCIPQCRDEYVAKLSGGEKLCCMISIYIENASSRQRYTWYGSWGYCI